MSRQPKPPNGANHHYATLRRILLASTIVGPLIPFVLVLAIGYTYFKNATETSTVLHMKRIALDHGQMIDSFLRERKADLTSIADIHSFESLRRPEFLQTTLMLLQKTSNAFLDLGVFDQDGLHVAYVGPYQLTGRNYSDADWFKAVLKNGFYISDVFLGYRRIPHFIIALTRKEGDRSWVLRATIDTDLFNQLVKKVKIGQTGEAYLLNSQGYFQTERRGESRLMEKDPETLIYPSPESGVRTFVEKDTGGIPYLFATTWLTEKKWLLVVRQEKRDAFAALRRASLLILLTSLLGGAVIILSAFILTNRIIRRMEEMDSEREQLGEQLVRAARLAELGEMAAGFAHEINNPLQIIKAEKSLIDSILSDMKENGAVMPSEDLTEIEDSMRQINTQIDRCAQITQAILKFGRKSEPVIQDIDLLRFIPEIMGMVSKKAAVHGISVQEKISSDTQPIHADPAQLQQVLLNLLNNAMDAVLARHGTEGGELLIGTEPAVDGQVKLFVKDNGCGISPENLKKIFSPFFTTKPVGKGTGLGLSVCYGIVDRMGGTMEVNSAEGVGTVFTLRLPAASWNPAEVPGAEGVVNVRGAAR